jgi:hypothetical protein
MPDQPLREPIIVNSLGGSSASDSGESIVVRLKLFGGCNAELIVPIAQAVELVHELRNGLQEAARNQVKEGKVPSARNR